MIKYSRVAGQVVKDILEQVRTTIKPGLSGKDLESLAVASMKAGKTKSSSLGYGGFPAAICVSINDELTHGVPDDRPFVVGDLVSVDVSCSYRGFHADAAITLLVEAETSQELANDLTHQQKKSLIKITEGALQFAISQIVPNQTTVQDIGAAIENYAASHNCFAIREYGGHGIGRMLHMDPFIPNFKTTFVGEVLKTGMLICIEPLVQFGNDKIKISENGGRILSRDGFLNAHFEHTILIGKHNVEIIT